jgi:predicted secreted protein
LYTSSWIILRFVLYGLANRWQPEEAKVEEGAEAGAMEALTHLSAWRNS